MVFKILLIAILFILLILADIFILATVIVFERSIRLKRLKAHLANFSPAELDRRMASYSESVKSNNEIVSIDQKIRVLNKREFTYIKKLFKKLESYKSMDRAFKFRSFNGNFNELIERIEKYEKGYLDIRFQLFDLTSDIEIEKAIIKQLWARYGKVHESAYNSPLPEINDNKKIQAKIKKVFNAIRALEKLVDDQIKHLGEDFTSAVKKIDTQTSKVAHDIDFVNTYIRHMDEELTGPIINLKDAFNENRVTLNEIGTQTRNTFTKIDEMKEEIRSEVLDLKDKSAIAKSRELDDMLAELNLLIGSNIDFAVFNDKYEVVSSKLLGHIKENDGLFISEIKRHKIQDESLRLLAIAEARQKFEDAVNKYEKAKLDVNTKKSPQDFSILLLNIVHEYTNYINVAREKVEDISEVNSLTNVVNEQIALMNTALLQVEFNINTITGVGRESYEKVKLELQQQVSDLKNYFKNNTNQIVEADHRVVAKVYNRVMQLAEVTKSSAFEVYFIKETIMFLNRLRGVNPMYDQMLDSINVSYNDEKYTHALRKIKEIIDIYEVK